MIETLNVKGKEYKIKVKREKNSDGFVAFYFTTESQTGETWMGCSGYMPIEEEESWLEKARKDIIKRIENGKL